MTVRCTNCFSVYEREYEICPDCGFVRGTAAEETFHISPGAILRGRFVIGMVLGYGGFCIIYKAWDKILQTIVAIKEYYPSGIVNRVPGTFNVAVYAKKREMEFNYGLSRFIDEAKNMAKFGTHSNIVNVYGYIEENHTAYIIMEYLDGVTLNEFLKNRRLDIQTSHQVILSICNALKTIHAVGIIHRDISPDNIFLCYDNRIKLIDFGTARFTLDGEKPLTVILKPGYAPPEQYERINLQGPWTDIYALGATFYLMLTGIKPDESTNRKVDDTLLPPSAINPNIPENTSNTIMRAMALDKHLRFETVEEFEKCLYNEINAVPIKKIITRRKRRRLATVLSSAVVVIIAITVFVYFFNEQRLEETLEDAKLLIWFELTGDDTLDKAKTEAYAAIFDAFCESYENIEIEVEAIMKDEYAIRLQSAIGSGAIPSLFETTDIEPPMLNNTADLRYVLGSVDASEYHFLDNYATYFPIGNQLPIGFSAPVVYINTTLLETDVDSVEESSIYTALREQFLDGEAEMLLSDTMDFFTVQEALPARYKLLQVEADDILCTFKDIWSIGASDANERRAAERLLVFMLSDNAQDHLYIRNSTGALPLNKTVLGTFMEVHMDFNGFFDNIESYVFSTTK